MAINKEIIIRVTIGIAFFGFVARVLAPLLCDKIKGKSLGLSKDQDFDSNGNLINSKIPKNIPVLIMIQADFCGYCTKAKPEFEKFAKKNEGKKPPL